MTDSNASSGIKRSLETIDIIKRLSQMGWSAINKPTPEEVMEYKAHLETVSDAEIHDAYLYRTALKMNVTEEFWVDHILSNSDLNDADMDYHCKMPRWSAEEGVAMLLKKELRSLELHNIKYHSCNSKVPFIRKHNKLLKLVRESIKYGELEEHFTPMAFVLWARKKDIEISDQLIELVTKYAGSNDIDWETRCKELEAENLALKQEIEDSKKPEDEEHLHLKIEKSYQQIIAALVLWKCPNRESINANYLSGKFAELDLPFTIRGVDTIYKRLEPVKMLLGIHPPSQGKKKENHKK